VKAVNIVQVERKLKEIGASEANMEGLTPVTRTPVVGTYKKAEQMEVDHLQTFGMKVTNLQTEITI
jgi:hypothetical protein